MKYLPLLLCTYLCAAEIKLGTSSLDVEVADTNELRRIGLSGRDSLPDGTGMLFIFDKPHLCSFWMKDTKVPLSIGFFDSDKKLFQCVDMLPPNKSGALSVYRSDQPAIYALEVPIGWFKKNQIQLGEKFEWVLK